MEQNKNKVERDLSDMPQVPDYVNSPEFRQYMDELFERLPAYAQRAAAVPPESKGSIEWYGRAGRLLWEAREKAGLSRYEVAERMHVPVGKVRFIEVGLADERELNDRFLESYAKAVGDPDLYVRFRKTFGLLQGMMAFTGSGGVD